MDSKTGTNNVCDHFLLGGLLKEQLVDLFLHLADYRISSDKHCDVYCSFRRFLRRALEDGVYQQLLLNYNVYLRLIFNNTETD